MPRGRGRPRGRGGRHETRRGRGGSNIGDDIGIHILEHSTTTRSPLLNNPSSSEPESSNLPSSEPQPSNPSSSEPQPSNPSSSEPQLSEAPIVGADLPILHPNGKT